MPHRNLRLFSAVLVLAAASLACQLAFSTAKVENLRVAQDEGGQQATTQFDPEDTFYLVGDLSNAPDDTQLKAIWTAIEVEGADPNTVLEERELAAPSGPFWFSLSQETGIWPAGRYKVELFLDDELNQSMEFQVVAPPEPTATPTATPEPTATPAPTLPAGGASLSGAFTALDDQGQQPSTAFAQADKIYTHFTLEAGQEVSSVKGTLVAVEAEGMEPNYQFTEIEENFDSGQNLIWFENSAPWPKGKYRVDLAVNGQPAQSLDIEVVSTNTSGAVVTEAYSTLDKEGQQASETFPPDGAIYIQFTLDSAPADTAVRGVMVAIDAEGQDPYTYITEAGGDLGTGTYTFTFTNDSPWPVGSYVVYIYLNGEFCRSGGFPGAIIGPPLADPGDILHRSIEPDRIAAWILLRCNSCFHLTGRQLWRQAAALEPGEADFLRHFSTLSQVSTRPSWRGLRWKSPSCAGRQRPNFQPPSGCISPARRWSKPRHFRWRPIAPGALPDTTRLLDLGCSIGGDTLALAAHGRHGRRRPGPAAAGDGTRQPGGARTERTGGFHPGGSRLASAIFTSRRHGRFLRPGQAIWRAARYYSVRDYQPPLSVLEGWLPRYPATCVKISPGVRLEEASRYAAEIEFISLNGELKEAALWFGPLRTARRRATVLPGAHSLHAGDDLSDAPAKPGRLPAAGLPV